MALIVQKYGGTSVGNAERIRSVAARISETRRKGNQVVVVVSAMGDTTDELLRLARAVTSGHYEREMDMLLSAGERVSMALLSMALRDAGEEAISFTGSQAGIITDESHTRARILEVRPTRVKEELSRGRTVIVAGFQGVSRAREITTLGRGGSDTTAVALAAALGADRCEVLTDVPGILSADPRVVSEPVRYPRLPLDLVLEMAVRGAQVMHPRAIEIAREKGFPIFVGHASSEEGTMLLSEVFGLELPQVVSVTSRRGLCRLSFPAERAGEILGETAREAVLVHDLKLTPGSGLEIVVDPMESRAFLDRHAAAVSDRELCAVSLVGHHLQQNTAIASRILACLGADGVGPTGLTCQSQSITVWFSGHQASVDGTAEVIRRLHSAFMKG